MHAVSTWDALRRITTPQWLREAKFGIYTHWGIYSVPACRPNGTWYPYNMYRPGSPQHAHHLRTYGDPATFGYKDFIPFLTGEKFDPDEWADLFRKAGAGFAGPVAEHHDGFAMWDTAYTRWNAKNMGPKRDVVAELEKAIRGQGMKFMVALHHAENWFFYPHWHPEYDVADPAYADLYGRAHDLDGTINDASSFEAQQKPDKAFLDSWLGKTVELVDRFSPDAIWFDFGLRHVQEHYKREMLAYYYGKAAESGQEVITLFKNNDLVVGSGLIDLELGRFDRLMQNEWITDTTVDDGEGWCYLHDAKYKSPRTLIHYLIDNVSKNGYLLLNVGPKPDGTIPEEARHILAEMGTWLALNGEAIYGTTPWMHYGEGPTQMSTSGDFTEREVMRYTPKDIRYTAKGETLYAICLEWSGDEYVLEKTRELYAQEIARITMVGVEKELAWKMTDNGLVVQAPSDKPCEYAYVLRIERKRPF